MLMNTLTKKLGADITRASVAITPQVLDRMAVNVTIKLISRAGVGGTKKFVEELLKGSKGSAWVQKFFRDNATKVKGKMNESQIAELMASELIKDPLAMEAFEAMVKGNVKKIEAELEIVVRKELGRRAREIEKKAKKKK